MKRPTITRGKLPTGRNRSVLEIGGANSTYGYFESFLPVGPLLTMYRIPMNCDTPLMVGFLFLFSKITLPREIARVATLLVLFSVFR
jgi:hypothetical protein